jgi:glycosyltransferase involved in cell wall biosynthesis
MRLGIDASNLRAGGGITHLVELLGAADPTAFGFSSVTVWGGRATLERVPDREWLTKAYVRGLDGGLVSRVAWQRFELAALARSSGCNAVFVPGGSYAGDFRPVVAMSRNLLPFEWSELRRYGFSPTGLRLTLLRWTQSSTFRDADGVIFLTQYAKDAVTRVVSRFRGQTTVIPHGIDQRFASPPRRQRPIAEYSTQAPYRLLYVSIVDVYKHQWKVVEAVARLCEAGMPLVLDLVGPGMEPALTRLKSALARYDPAGRYVRYLGAVPHEQIHACYANADLCIFASSCENMPNILLEGMASGLPIACANRGPMPEVLGAAGEYCDPESPDDIARAIRRLADDPQLRERLARASFERSREYSWQRCATGTFGFLRDVATARAHTALSGGRI